MILQVRSVRMLNERSDPCSFYHLVSPFIPQILQHHLQSNLIIPTSHAIYGKPKLDSDSACLVDFVQSELLYQTQSPSQSPKKSVWKSPDFPHLQKYQIHRLLGFPARPRRMVDNSSWRRCAVASVSEIRLHKDLTGSQDTFLPFGNYVNFKETMFLGIPRYS